MAADLDIVLVLFCPWRVKGFAEENPSDVTRRESKVETKRANMTDRNESKV